MGAHTVPVSSVHALGLNRTQALWANREMSTFKSLQRCGDQTRAVCSSLRANYYPVRMQGTSRYTGTRYNSDGDVQRPIHTDDSGPKNNTANWNSNSSRYLPTDDRRLTLAVDFTTHQHLAPLVIPRRLSEVPSVRDMELVGPLTLHSTLGAQLGWFWLGFAVAGRAHCLKLLVDREDVKTTA